MFYTITQADIEEFAKAARLSIEEAELLLEEGQQYGWEPEILSCLGEMAIGLVEADRRKKLVAE